MSECEHLWHWFPAINERGWRCVECDLRPGEPPGFSPHLDREQTYFKVGGILHDLDSEKFICVSNGSMGDSITDMVTRRCKQEKRYDQYSIIRFILDAMGNSHEDYWQKIGDGIMSGNDPRDRCDECNELATSWDFGPDGKKRRCSQHYRIPKEFLEDQ